MSWNGCRKVCYSECSACKEEFTVWDKEYDFDKEGNLIDEEGNLV